MSGDRDTEGRPHSGPEREAQEGVRSREDPAVGGMDRLPPPAFPPGARRPPVPRPRAPDEAAGRRWIHEGFPEGALISPDEPVRRISADFPEDAFISPDDPFRRRARMAGSSPGEPAVGDDVEITGIGESDPSYYRASSVLQADVRDVGQAAQVLERLARRMREDGAAALLIEPGLARFDSVLRSFVAGYLAHARD